MKRRVGIFSIATAVAIVLESSAALAGATGAVRFEPRGRRAALSGPPVRNAQKQTDAERAAQLVVHWQQIIYPAFEDARASIDEENSDHLNALLSQGAVRLVQDRVDSAGVRKIDSAVGRLVAAIVKAAARQPGGSLIIDSAAFEKGLDAACPLYPFCDR